MDILETTPLPQLTVEKIYIETEKVIVNAYLTTKDNQESPYFMDERYFTDFVNIHFLLVPNDQDVLKRRLSDHKSRVSNIVSEGAPINAELRLQWFQTLSSDYDNKTITLSEAINRDSENNVRTSGIRGANQQRAANLRDISFSIEIPFSNITLNSESIETLHLYAFAHLDAGRIVEEFNLSSQLQSIVNLLEIGGNLSSDRILEKDINGNLSVPAEITILTYEDGTPYIGSYHYHDGDGPGGYTGYMEGPAAPHMSPTARTLRTAVVPYRKVIANFILDDNLFQSLYNGSEEELSALESNYNSPFVADSSAIGMVFESTSGYDRDGGNLLRIYDPDFQNDLVQRQFNQSLNIGLNGIVYNADHTIETKEVPGTESTIAYHRLEFKVDFKKLVKTKSKYPFFINKAAQAFGYTEDEIFTRSKILDMSIFRRRLSNSARSNNPVGTADYNNYTSDEEEMLIASSAATSDTYRIEDYFDEFRGRNWLVLSEDQDSSPETREYILNDYDMGENINFGRYAYRVQFIVEDIIKSLIQENIATFKTYLAKYDNFIGEASIPSIPIGKRFIGRKYYLPDIFGSNYEEEDTTGLQGSLDIYTEQYTQQFKTKSELEHDTDTRTLIDLFTKLHILISPNNFNSAEVQQRLISGILPSEGGTFESALKFRSYCFELLKNYENILRRDNTIQLAGASKTTMSTINIGNKHPSGPDTGIINFSRDIPGYAEAFPPGQVLVTYDIDDLLNTNRVSNRDPLAPILTDQATAGDLSAPSDGLNEALGDGFWISPGAVTFFTGDDIEVITTFDDIIEDPLFPGAILDDIINSPPELTGVQNDILQQGQVGGGVMTIPGLQGGVLPDFGVGPYRNLLADVSKPLVPTNNSGGSLIGVSDPDDLIGFLGSEGAVKVYDQGNTSPSTTYGSIKLKINNIASGGSSSGNFMKKEAGSLMIQTADKSPVATYMPATAANLQAVGSATVKVKAGSSGSSTSGNYSSTNNVAKVNAKDLASSLGVGAAVGGTSATSATNTYVAGVATAVSATSNANFSATNNRTTTATSTGNNFRRGVY